MTWFDLLLRLDVDTFSSIVFDSSKWHKTPEDLKKRLCEKISDKDLKEIQAAAAAENYQRLFSSDRQ